MGIDYAGLTQILEVVPQLSQKKSLLMLGRQKMHFSKQHLKDSADTKLDRLHPGVSIDKLTETTDYAEPFFRALGVSDVTSMDYSDYEGADIVHDLNKPIPDALHGKYDIVLDGGTLEHVFDVKTAMTNAHDLLAPGGTFIGISPGNNFFAHGFYQFSPDMVFSFWKRGKGCEILNCTFLPEFPRDKSWTIEDPYETKRRLRMRGKQVPQRCYLFYAARKPEDEAVESSGVLQGDYTHRWREAEAE